MNQKARDALGAAQLLDSTLLMWQRPPDDRLLMNRLLISPPLTEADLPDTAEPVAAERVAAQLSRRLLGGGSAGGAWMLPVLGALVAFAWGFAGRSMKASRECEKCGRPVCRRCDKELGVASKMCAQCVNVFIRRTGVDPGERVRKESAVEAYHRRRRMAARVLAVLCGAGHVLLGYSIRGLFFLLVTSSIVASLLLGRGAAHDPLALRQGAGALGVAFALLLLAGVYTLCLRDLFARQRTEEGA